jgi:hypothetical protein
MTTSTLSDNIDIQQSPPKLDITSKDIGKDDVVHNTLMTTSTLSDNIEITSKDIEREIAMYRGKVYERNIINRLGATYNVLIDNKHYFKDLETCIGKNKYRLGGRIDAFQLDDNGDRIGIFEIKCRTHYFKYVPEYDIDQLACYCFIMDRDGSKIRNYYIVEEMDDELYITPYKYKDLIRRYNQLQPVLELWIDRMCSINDNPFQPDLINIIDKYGIPYNV